MAEPQASAAPEQPSAEQLLSALEKAHLAGDTAAAREFANWHQELYKPAPEPEPPGMVERGVNALRSFVGGDDEAPMELTPEQGQAASQVSDYGRRGPAPQQAQEQQPAAAPEPPAPQQPDAFSGAARPAPEQAQNLNAGRGAVERLGDLGAGALTAINAAADSAENAMPLGGFVWEEGKALPSYKTPEQYAQYKEQGGQESLSVAADQLRDLDAGYVPTNTWESVKQEFGENGALAGSAWGEVLAYGAEQGIQSIPDMVAATLSLPAYVLARSGEIGEARALNKGKDETELTDVLEAAPFALGSAILERIGAKGITQAGAESVGKEALKRGVAYAAARTAQEGGSAAAREGATEFVQEGVIEYLGERFGTDAAMSFAEAGEMGLAGAVAGGVYGGAAGTATAGAREATRQTPEAELGRAMQQEADGAQFQGDPSQIAAERLAPENAQMQQTPGPVAADASPVRKSMADLVREKLQERGLALPQEQPPEALAQATTELAGDAAWEQAWKDQGMEDPTANLPDTTIDISGAPEAPKEPTSAAQDSTPSDGIPAAGEAPARQQPERREAPRIGETLPQRAERLGFTRRLQDQPGSPILTDPNGVELGPVNAARAEELMNLWERGERDLAAASQPTPPAASETASTAPKAPADNVELRANNQPFKTESSALSSAKARHARSIGRRVEAVPQEDGGFGFRIESEADAQQRQRQTVLDAYRLAGSSYPGLGAERAATAARSDEVIASELGVTGARLAKIIDSVPMEERQAAYQESANGQTRQSYQALDEQPAEPEAEATPEQAADESPTVTTYTPAGDPVDVRYRVVEASELVASNDIDGNVNPDYPAEVQPRSRGRLASRAQMLDIAANPIANRLMESAETDRGAPIIGEGGVVESGNGRTAGLREAYRRGTADAYRQEVAAAAQRLGLGTIDGMREPVLVRERATPMTAEQRRDFAAASNRSASLGMSPAEQAASDARNMPEDTIARLRVGDDGDVLASSNREFLDAFSETLGANETAQYRLADGQWNSAFRQRVERAVFATAYGDTDLLTAISESPNPELRNLLAAMMQAAPVMARLQTVAPAEASDLAGVVVEAVGAVSRSRSERQSLDEILGQGDMLGDAVSPDAALLARIFDTNIRSARRLGTMLRSVAEQIEAPARNQNQPDLLTGETASVPSVSQVIRQQENNRGQEQTQAGDLFGANTSTRASEGDGQGQPRAGERTTAQVAQEAKVTPPAAKKAKPKRRDSDTSAMKAPTTNPNGAAQIARDLMSRHPSLKLALRARGNVVTVDRIELAPDARENGTGTRIMGELVSWADTEGKTLALTPTGDFGGNKKRLSTFYKRFDFVENKGRNRDFEISEAMLREPKAAPATPIAQGEQMARHASPWSATAADKANMADTSDLSRDQPMPRWRPTYRMLGVNPRRPASGEFPLGNRTIKLKPEDDATRREGIRVMVIDLIGPRLYQGKVKGRTTLGFYRQSNSEVRIANFDDVEVMAHELAHYLDFHYRYNERFTNAYQDPAVKAEVEQLSYTSQPQLVGKEGFAEFVRLWLTQYDEASSRAPDFTAKFEQLLKQDKALRRKMTKMQEEMHRWYQQGDLAQAYAVTSGNDYTLGQQTALFIAKRPGELWRQRYVDKLHAAKVMGRTTSGELRDASIDAYKQLQLLNGIEGISQESFKMGALSVNEDGDIVFSGPSLRDVWQKSLKAGPKVLREQELYFIARRAQELKSQGRENLISNGMMNEGLAMADKHPHFVQAFSDYQAYRANMMEFYVDSGYVTQDAADAMMEANKNYVPFHRVVESVNAAYTGGGAGFQRLTGGQQNIKPVYDNMMMQEQRHMYAALKARALRSLYQEALKSQDGSLFLAKIGPDSKPVKAAVDQMASKTAGAMADLGISISEDGRISGDGETVVDKADIEAYFEENQEQLMFWTFGHKPKTTETMVDSFIDGTGKRVWIEIQKENQLLVDMLDNMDYVALPEGAWGTAIKLAMRVKNFQTLTITSMAQFVGPNLFRDAQQAWMLSGGRFRPGWDTMIGLGAQLHSLVSQKGAWHEMKAQGGPAAGRVRTFYHENWGLASDIAYKPRRPFYHPGQWANTLLDVYMSIADSAEIATRLGFYMRQRDVVGAREAAWQAREISTDFRKHGTYAPWVLLQRTVPFLGAYVQSVDRDIRALAENQGEMKLSNLVKTDTGRATLRDIKVRIWMTGALIIGATAALALLNDDEERYRALTPDQKTRFFNLFIGGKHYTLPKPHGFISLMAQAAETAMDTMGRQSGDDAWKTLAFATGYHFGGDAMPGVLNPVAEVALNRTFTGAPVVSRYAQDREARYQYTDRTPQLYINAGRVLNVSPDKARHLLRGYTGYLSDFVDEYSEALIWDTTEWGPRPFARDFGDMMSKQFKPREVAYRTKWTTGYYELRNRAATAQANMSFLRNNEALRDQAPLEEFAADRVNTTLLGINRAFSRIDSAFSNQDEVLASIKYDPELTAEEKETQIEAYYAQKNDALGAFYRDVSEALEEVEDEIPSN